MENVVWFARTGDRDLSAACRKLLERALGFSPRVEKREGGQPFLPEHPELSISFSHTGGAVAAALSESPVGVDLEGPRPVNLRLAERFFTAAELAYAVDEARFLEVWTRKEALLKREGRGIRVRLSGVETLGREDLSTRRVGEYILSFCGTPAAFTLHETAL